MRGISFLIAAILFVSSSANAGRDNFSMIDGKNYYELLGVDKGASLDDLKAAQRRLMKKYHPDAAGKEGEEMSKNINAAFDVLKDANTRQRYDSWLRTGTYSSRAGADSTREEDPEEENAFRKNQVNLTADYVLKEAVKMRQEYPHGTFDDFVNMGRSHVVYFVRFMPMADYRGEDLYDFIFFRGVRDFEAGKISQDALAMIAGGALTYLTELASYGGSTDYRSYFERARHMIRTRLERYRDDLNERQIWDNLWKITSNGRSYYPPPVRARPANSCEAQMSATVTKDGMTFTIPITISIKIGR